MTEEPGKLYPVQTKGGGTLDSAWSDVDLSIPHLCYKTYYVCERLGEIRPIIVKVYVVPGLKYDLLLVNGLNHAKWT